MCPSAVSPAIQLKRFSTKQQLLFSLSLTERALPFYKHFANKEGMNTTKLSITIASMWDSYDQSQSIETVDVPIPDSWNKVGRLAGGVIRAGFDFYRDKDTQHIEQQMEKLLDMCRLLGDGIAEEESQRQSVDMEGLRNLMEDNPELLTAFITDSLVTATQFARSYL